MKTCKAVFSFQPRGASSKLVHGWIRLGTSLTCQSKGHSCFLDLGNLDSFGGSRVRFSAVGWESAMLGRRQVPEILDHTNHKATGDM